MECFVITKCTKFGQLILRKIIKIVATRCQILRLKCTKFDFSWGSTTDPAGGANSSSPDPLAGFWGPLRGRGRGWAGEEEGKGREGEVEGREREGPQVTVEPGPLRSLATPLINILGIFTEGKGY